MQESSNPQGKSQPTTDAERRKQADQRRPMIMRRILIWNMDEKVDLEKRFREQLARKQLTEEAG
jgi:hypothetical protein